MRPALSVILFTVLSGAGLGALALVALADLASQALARTLAPGSMTTVSVIALALVIAGLGASTLHLAKPSNAWRSPETLELLWSSAASLRLRDRDASEKILTLSATPAGLLEP